MANNGLKNVLIGISKSLKSRVAAWIAKTDKYSLFSLALVSGNILALKNAPPDDPSKFLPVSLTLIVICNTVILLLRKVPKVYEVWHETLLRLYVIQHQAVEKRDTALYQAGINALVEEYYQAVRLADERYKDDDIARVVVKTMALRQLKLVMREKYGVTLKLNGRKVDVKFRSKR